MLCNATRNGIFIVSKHIGPLFISQMQYTTATVYHIQVITKCKSPAESGLVSNAHITTRKCRGTMQHSVKASCQS